jgi:hypothetical protein
MGGYGQWRWYLNLTGTPTFEAAEADQLGLADFTSLGHTHSGGFPRCDLDRYQNLSLHPLEVLCLRNSIPSDRHGRIYKATPQSDMQNTADMENAAKRTKAKLQ